MSYRCSTTGMWNHECDCDRHRQTDAEKQPEPEVLALVHPPSPKVES